ncbi:hypothetical protein ACFLY4_00115 [Chloroflexota bacterium]
MWLSDRTGGSQPPGRKVGQVAGGDFPHSKFQSQTGSSDLSDPRRRVQLDAYLSFLNIQRFGDAILHSRDFIVYNQRGAPLSEPSLGCPGYGNLLYDLARKGDSSREEGMTQMVTFLRSRATISSIP